MRMKTCQDMSFIVDLLQRISPRRTLDVGMGLDRWGLYLKETFDARSGGSGEACRLEALVAPDQDVAPHQEALYHQIQAGEFAATIEESKEPFDAILLLNLLDLLPRSQAQELLQQAVRKAAYVFVNVPLGGESGGNLDLSALTAVSFWELQDFDPYPVVWSRIVEGGNGSYHAFLILSGRDPRRIGQFIPSGDAAPRLLEEQLTPLRRDMDKAVRMVRDLKYELSFIKKHPVYRHALKLFHNPLSTLVRKLRNGDRNAVTVTALGERSEASQGEEVWLISGRFSEESPSVPWDFVYAEPEVWKRRPLEDGPYQQCLVATRRGQARFSSYSEMPVVEFITHPWSGKVEVAFRGRTTLVDLYSPAGGRARLYPATGQIVRSEAALAAPAGENGKPAAPAVQGAAAKQAHDEAHWLDEMHRKKVKVLALHVPRWLGITNSTNVLFEHTYPFPKSPAIEPYHIHDSEIKRQAELILESGVEHLVCSGGDEVHYKLVREVKRRKPEVRCDMLWHGSYVHFGEDYNWKLVQLWTEAAREGLVHTIGTVKKGMEQLFTQLGCRSKFVMNYVPEIPKQPSKPLAGGPHIGLWSSGENPLKAPYIMIAACKLIPEAVLHGTGFRTRAGEVIDFLKLSVAEIHQAQLPMAELLKAIRQTHLTLYVTFSECCPMLPLESLSVGVPCLIGPTSHLFEDHEYLHGRLVVPYPDRADVIAQFMRRALEERDKIVQEYIRYAPGYNKRARQSVSEFLS